LGFSNFYFLSVNEKRMDCINVSNKLKSSAHQKPSMLNPEINQSISIIMTALITRRNKPNVIKVAGRVKKTKSGFIVMFKSASTAATINEVVNVSTCAPGSISARTKTTTAVNNNWIISFIFWFYELVFSKSNKIFES
jgi:hypothetical protein